MNKTRAQVSIEFLQILAVSALVLVFFIAISQSTGADINQAKAESEAKNAISDIAGAAKEVYAQGLGAKKKVYVTIPSGIETQKTYVANNTIRMHVDGNDYVGMETFDMHGTLPTSSGGHWIWVMSEGNKVRIGYAMVALSRQTLLVTLTPNETESKGFDITNIWGRKINVSIADHWNHGDVAFSMSQSSASLDVDGSETFKATFTTNDKAIGLYISELEITATEGTSKEYIKLPVLVQVVAEEKDRAPLTAIPPLLNASLNWSDSVTRSFQICTNEVTAVTSVDFIPSGGAPGLWVENTGSLGPIAPDSCAQKILILTVPNGAMFGNKRGFVRVLGNGAADAEDTIALNIEVGGKDDNEGPIVRNITTRVRRVHVYEPVTIYAVGDDSTTGNSSIKECQIRVDNETDWEYMQAVDGAFNSSIENISHTFINGFGIGKHTAYLRCTDNRSNVGSPESYNFTIGKQILFVISSGNESDWSDWVSVNHGNISYDIAIIDEIISGEVDMYNYDATIFLDWSKDSDFVNKVLEYQNLGGFVGLFGDSAHLAVRDLNVTWHPDNPHPEFKMNILNNSHYVTSGFPLGLLEISDVGAKVYEVWGDPVNTTELGASGWFYPSTDRMMLAEVDNTMFWGPQDPFKLNQNGVTISVRVIDWMINQSRVE